MAETDQLYGFDHFDEDSNRRNAMKSDVKMRLTGRMDWIVKVIVVIIMMAMACQVSSAAAITVGNTQASGQILAASGNESSSILHNSNSNFLAVVITVVADGTTNLSIAATPTVTYNGDALTHATSLITNRSFSAVYYLANPEAGSNTLAVNFGADVLVQGAGAWEFGAVSLTGVDLTNPIAHASNFNANGLTSVTLTSPTIGSISAGDFLLIGNAVDNAIPSPNWTTAGGSQATFYNNDDPSGAGAREYNAQYGVVVAGDLSGINGDAIVLTSTQSRFGARAAVVFNNIIPEPGTAGLLLVAGLLVASRRRRV